MNSYIVINDKRIELTEEQVKLITAAYGQTTVQLETVPVGQIVKVGDQEMVVLEHSGDTTALIRKNLLPDTQFGDSNNYDGSYVDAACNEFAERIAGAVGEENVVPHTVDLTSDDGLKDYGQIQRLASLLTADQYRRYVAVLDQHKPGDWWWLATAHSTAAHDNDRWVKCVAPSGFVFNYVLNNNVNGVRPFCILKSNIFVSK